MKRNFSGRYVLRSGGRAWRKQEPHGQAKAFGQRDEPERECFVFQDETQQNGEYSGQPPEQEAFFPEEGTPRPEAGDGQEESAPEREGQEEAPSPEEGGTRRMTMRERMRSLVGGQEGQTRLFRRQNIPEPPMISEQHLYEGGAQESMFTQRTRPRSFGLSVLFTTLKILLVMVVALGFAGLGAVLGIARSYVQTSPELDIGLIENQAQTSIIYDANGDVITNFVGLENREWASIDEIPDMLENAFVAIEDVRFYKHSGVDLKRLISAVINTLRNKNTHGGSTITQQLIKNRVLSNEQSYKRKIQEAYLAFELEREYDKSDILEAYLNAIPLGGLNYGVKAAAKDYFGKELSQLTIRECAMLAGLTQNPTKYNPRSNMYDENRDFQVTEDRTNTVLAAMYSAGFITKEQYESAKAEKVTIFERSTVSQMYDMPAFVEYAVTDVITYMLKDRGLEDTKANRSALEKELRTGGYHIYTTVDPEIQNTVQDTLATWEDYPRIADPTYSVRISKNADGTIDEIVQPQAAAVVIDQHTGQIKAMVGSRDEPTRKKLLNRAYQSNMPIGSSIKPIAVYAPALENGVSPASVILNFAQEIEGYGGSKGYPSGGLTKQGPVTMRKGVVSSLNVVAARVLYEKVGTEAAREYLIQLGVNPDNIFADGPGLALGTSGISMLELTAAYATLANSGTYLEPISFTKVTDAQGNVILDAEKLRQTRQVFKPATCWMMTSMLEDAVSGGTGTAARISGMHVAGKTGTNDNYRGVTFAGYTPYYTSAVWIGHDDYRYPLKSGSTGGGYAAPLWQAYMEPIHEELEDREILNENPQDLGLVKAKICSVSGLLATEACDGDPDGRKPVTDWFSAGTVPTKKCNMHGVVSICQESGQIAGEYCPAEQVKQSVVLVIPTDCDLATINEELLKEYMPSAIRGLTGISDLTNLKPELVEKYLCSVHDANSSGLPSQDEIDYAGELIDFARGMLTDPYYDLTEEQQSQLIFLSAQLQNALSTGAAAEDVASLSRNLYTLCVSIQEGTGGNPGQEETGEEIWTP